MAKRSRPFDLLIFDWDGTLMDSTRHIISAMQAACADLRLEIPSDDSVRHVIGLGLDEAIGIAVPDLERSSQRHFRERYRYHFLAESMGPARLFPDVKDMLLGLKAGGYELAVATGKGRAGLNRVLREQRLLELFHVTRCADETFSKPHPKMLEEILLDRAVPATRSVMIGDTTYDLEMARRAGMPGIGVSGGAHDDALLAECRPLHILRKINELPAILDQLAQRGRQGQG